MTHPISRLETRHCCALLLSNLFFFFLSHSHSNPATGLAPSHRLGPLLVLHWTVVDGRTNQPLNSLLPWEKNSPAVRRSISGFSFAQGPPWAPGPLSARRARPPAWNVISALPPSNHHLYGIQPKRLIGQTAPSNRFRPGGKTAKRCYSGCDLHSLRLLKHDNTPGESVSVYLKKEAEIDSAAICCCYSCVQNEQCTTAHPLARSLAVYRDSAAAYWPILAHTGPYPPSPCLSQKPYMDKPSAVMASRQSRDLVLDPATTLFTFLL